MYAIEKLPSGYIKQRLLNHYGIVESFNIDVIRVLKDEMCVFVKYKKRYEVFIFNKNHFDWYDEVQYNKLYLKFQEDYIDL